jgi:hypothetical protein
VSGATTAGERLRHELREYAIVVAYLFVCFSAVLAYKASVSTPAGVAYLPFGLALVKALILGKFLLIGQALGVGTRGRTRRLLHQIARKTLLLWLLLIAFSIVEEFVVGAVHGQSPAAVIAGYEAQSAFALIASSVLLLLILIPFVAVSETGRAMGPGALAHLLLGEPASSDSTRGADHTP